MGYRWEVLAWMDTPDEGFHDIVQYQGQSLIVAIRAAWEAKRLGAGCVKIHWR